MLKLFITLLTAFTITLLSPSSTHAAIDGHLTVTSPSGGEVWKEGETHTISWDASDNIDKVSIMYKSDAHHGNWVEFSHPTTGSGSYSWNVDVGNTTNTQFYIQITGYETGKGSTSDFSEYLTINQKDDAPTKPDPTATPTPTSTPTPATTPRPTQPPIQIDFPITVYNTWLSITNINIWNIFIFEGSNTTNLSDVEDPENVSDFTLDTPTGFEFVFLEPLDMTSQDTLRAINTLDDYWVVEEWFFWIKWEWWEEYEITTPITVEYENNQLTAYEPNITDQASEEDKPSKYQILGSSDEGLTIQVDGGAKLKIEPKVTLDGGEDQVCRDSSCVLTGYSSHKDLTYHAIINGKESDIELTSFDDSTGKLELTVTGLVEGANYIELSYQNDQDQDQDPVEFATRTIYFRPNPLLKLWVQHRVWLLTVIGFLLTMGAGIAIGTNITSIQKNLTKTTKLIKQKLK